ncbi:MAG: hypothetical protein P1P89_22045 [Desulfobacterales bacterium]|nr:hypothetical protein [Desulfobacterales bacterium]
MNAVASGDNSREPDYDWIMLEMYDQTVRNFSGGEMAAFLADLDEKNRPFVCSRIGAEAEKFWEPEQISPHGRRLNTLPRKIYRRKLVKLSREKLAGWLVYLIAGKTAFKNFRMGIFRGSGEVHQWMYDRFSLKRLLEQAGFVDVKICAANESRIPDYEKYSLDLFNGRARKPDSLYIEATKP